MINTSILYQFSKEILKVFCSIVFVLSSFQQLSAQEEKLKNIQIGVVGSTILEGSELSNSYTNLLGIEANYFFRNTEKFRYYGTTGFTTDLDGTGAAISLIDLGLGVQYNLFNIKNNPFYATLNAGGLYIHEEFSTQLIESQIQSTITEFGYTASLGVGYYFLQNINLQLNLSQMNTQATSVGVSLYYSF